jgi:hypothetical protein
MWQVLNSILAPKVRKVGGIDTLADKASGTKHDQNVVSRLYAKLGRLGGAARARALTPERRREIAIKASWAAGVAKQRAQIEGRQAARAAGDRELSE